jgi:hypothetical protein
MTFWIFNDTRKEIFSDRRQRGASAVLFLIASLLVAGLIFQTANILLESARMLHLKKIFFIAQEDHAVKTTNDFKDSVMRPDYELLHSGRSRLSILEVESDMQMFQPLVIHSEKNFQPILWRRFLLHTSESSICESKWEPCVMDTVRIDKSIRSYNQEISIKTTDIDVYDQRMYLAFAGTLHITKALEIVRKEGLSHTADITVIFSVFGDLFINRIEVDSSLSENNLQVILYAHGGITLGDFPEHKNCTSKSSNLSLFMQARSLQIKEESADLSPYSTCISEIAPEWFPEIKMAGFSRKEPE